MRPLIAANAVPMMSGSGNPAPPPPVLPPPNAANTQRAAIGGNGAWLKRKPKTTQPPSSEDKRARALKRAHAKIVKHALANEPADRHTRHAAEPSPSEVLGWVDSFNKRYKVAQETEKGEHVFLVECVHTYGMSEGEVRSITGVGGLKCKRARDNTPKQRSGWGCGKDQPALPHHSTPRHTV